MAIVLEGGCRVVGLKEGQPEREGALRIWKHFGRDTGAQAISLRVLELEGSATWRNEFSDEVLYVIAGNGTLTIGGVANEIAPDVGIYVPSGTPLEINTASAMTLVSSQCPGDGRPAAGATRWLRDCPLQQTGDRWYCEVIQGEVTQFVGAIPPGRAPDHYHLYEEVLCILEGEGLMWAGTSHTPIVAGSCIFLPRRQVHCVENRGTTPLRLLGVFYPAGSPAVRYGA